LREKKIYLLDETVSNLNPKVAKEVRGLVLNPSKNRIIPHSSHNLYGARGIGNAAVTIKSGELAMFGKIDEIKTEKYEVRIRTFGNGELFRRCKRMQNTLF
jgi:ABC-type multidrug transport system ATPase subunit